MASRKRACSHSSPSSKPSKRRKVTGATPNSPVEKGTIAATEGDAPTSSESVVDVDEEDAVFGTDEGDAAIGNDGEDVATGHDVGGTVESQLPDNMQEVWNIPAIRDMVRRYLEKDRQATSFGERYLTATLYSNIVEDFQFTSEAFRKKR
jgi:hypothetical protein